MPILFPTSPTQGQTYTSGSTTWTWTGQKWRITSGAANLTAIASNIVPAHNEVYDLGHSTLRWRDLYLSGNTLDLGGTAIKSTAEGVSFTSAANAEAAVALSVSSITIGTGNTAISLSTSGNGLVTSSPSGNVTSSLGATGATGVAGPVGATGPIGATGPAGTDATVAIANTAPVSPTNGKLWLDTDAGDLYAYFANTWIMIGGGSSGGGSAVYDVASTSTGYFDLPSGNTAQRPASPPTGALRYNSTTGFAEVYTAVGWGSFGAQPPSISTVSPVTYNGESGTQFTINGANFTVDASVKFIDNNNVEYTAGQVTFVDSSTLLATTPQDFSVAQEPLDVKVSQASGQVTRLDCIDCGGVPVWSTPSGSLGIIYDGYPYTRTVVAVDPDNLATITMTIVSGQLPTGLTLSANGYISGNIPVMSSDTTYNFTIRAQDNAGNQTDRAFSFNVVASNYFGTGNDGPGVY